MITWKKEGIFKNERELKKIDPSNLHKYFNDRLIIEDGVLFKDIFDVIIHNKKFYDDIFYSYLGGHSIEDFFYDYLTETKNEKNLDSVEFSWIADVYEIDGVNEISQYIHFGGMNGDEHYSLSFTPLFDMKNLKVVLDNEFEIQNLSKTDEKPIKYIKEFTLFDIISTLLYEISFYGTPERRNDIMDDLSNTIKEIDKGVNFEVKYDEKGRMFYVNSDGNIEYLDNGK